MPLGGWLTSRLPPAWIVTRTASATDDEGSAPSVWLDCVTGRGRVDRAVSPPEQVAEVVAVACELPARHERPLGRFSRTELHRLVIEQGVTDASATTIWRWLHDRSLKPWQQRSWIFPRDPHFQPKAGRVLDLYVRRFEGRRLHPDEYVICRRREVLAAGARAPPRNGAGRAWPAGAGRVRIPARRHAGLPGRLGRPPRPPLRALRGQDRDRAVRPPRRAGHEHRALRVGQDGLLGRRHGSSHAGQRSIDRLENAYPNARLIHLPIHARGLTRSRSTSRSCSARR